MNDESSAEELALPLPTPNELESLPLFPLPDSVLLPWTLLPLHIFEPRYRAMMEWSLERHAPIGLALLKPGYEKEYFGRPQIHAVLGVGRVGEYKKLPDGRYDLLLHGVGRVEVVEEIEGAEEPFRLARCRLRPDGPALPLADGERRLAALKGLLMVLGRSRPRLATVLTDVILRSPSPDIAAHLVASLVLDSSQARQGFLELDSTSDRLEVVTAAVAALIPSTLIPDAELN